MAREEHLFRGLCTFQKAQQSTAQNEMRDALSEFDAVLGSTFYEPTERTDGLSWAAYLDKAMISLWLGIHGQPRDWLTNLRRAENVYLLALAKSPQRSDPTFASIVHDDLAVVLRNETRRSEGSRSTQFLRGAVRNYDESLRGLSELSDGNLWAATEYDLAITLENLASNLGGDEGKNILRDALRANG